MKIKDVVILKEVVNDLNDGKAFYETKRTELTNENPNPHV